MKKISTITALAAALSAPVLCAQEPAEQPTIKCSTRVFINGKEVPQDQVKQLSGKEAAQLMNKHMQHMQNAMNQAFTEMEHAFGDTPVQLRGLHGLSRQEWQALLNAGPGIRRNGQILPKEIEEELSAAEAAILEELLQAPVKKTQTITPVPRPVLDEPAACKRPQFKNVGFYKIELPKDGKPTPGQPIEAKPVAPSEVHPDIPAELEEVIRAYVGEPEQQECTCTSTCNCGEEPATPAPAPAVAPEQPVATAPEQAPVPPAGPTCTFKGNVSSSSGMTLILNGEKIEVPAGQNIEITKDAEGKTIVTPKE